MQWNIVEKKYSSKGLKIKKFDQQGKYLIIEVPKRWKKADEKKL